MTDLPAGHPQFADGELAELLSELRDVFRSLSCGHEHGSAHDGMKRMQFWVLSALADGPQKMSDLALKASTSQASLTGIVDRLEERALVERTRSGTDRRVVDVTLTADGRRELCERHACMLERLETVLEPLDAGERRTFLELVRKLAKSQDSHC